MQLKITKSGPGCVYQPGALLRMEDKRAAYLIEQGFAEPVVVPQRREMVEVSPKAVPTPPPMEIKPPRYICGCGQVFKSKTALKNHRSDC